MTDANSGKRLSDAELAEFRFIVEKRPLLTNASTLRTIAEKLLSHIASLTPTSGGNVEERARELVAVAYSTIHVSDGTKEALIRAGKNPSIPANAAILAVSQALSQSPPHACCEGTREKAAKVALNDEPNHVWNGSFYSDGYHNARVDIAKAIRALPLPVSADGRDDTPEAFGVQPRSHRLSEGEK